MSGSALSAEPFWLILPGESYHCRIKVELDEQSNRVKSSISPLAGRSFSTSLTHFEGDLHVDCDESSTLVKILVGKKLRYFLFRNSQFAIEGFPEDGIYNGALSTIYSVPFFATILPYKTRQVGTLVDSSVLFSKLPGSEKLRRTIAERGLLTGFRTAVTGVGNQLGMLRPGFVGSENSLPTVYEGVPGEFLQRGIWKNSNSFKLEVFEGYGNIARNSPKNSIRRVGVISYSEWEKRTPKEKELKPPLSKDVDVTFDDGNKVLGLRWMSPTGKLIEQLGRQDLAHRPEHRCRLCQ